MERQISVMVNNGGVKLPIGFRFLPTDEELVVHYLKRKAFGLTLPASIIPEFDVFKSHPQSFLGDLSERNRYFFCKINRSCFNNISKRSTGSGYWKPIGKETQIFASGSNQTVGTRRTLVFYESSKCSKRTKTGWFMKEYHLMASTVATNQVQGMGNEEEWCIYNLFKRKCKATRRKLNGIPQECFLLNTIDFSTQADQYDIGPPPPSPSSSAEDFPLMD